jgi:hypothetical protein
MRRRKRSRAYKIRRHARDFRRLKRTGKQRRGPVPIASMEEAEYYFGPSSAESAAAADFFSQYTQSIVVPPEEAERWRRAVLEEFTAPENSP